jgi:hypothetical protein
MIVKPIRQEGEMEIKSTIMINNMEIYKHIIYPQGIISTTMLV